MFKESVASTSETKVSAVGRARVETGTCGGHDLAVLALRTKQRLVMWDTEPETNGEQITRRPLCWTTVQPTDHDHIYSVHVCVREGLLCLCLQDRCDDRF